jgi:hypothetical protein
MWVTRANVPDFERYRVILDKKPFGEAPVVDNRPPPAPPPNPAESFARAIRISVMYEEENGELRIGFVDDQKKDFFFLKLGEIHEGIELVSADYEEGEAVLRRGAEVAIIKQKSASVEAITPEQLQQRQQNRPLSYEERRRRRAEEEERRRNQPPPEPRLTGAELEAHLKNYQMEVIRQGLPPLPIPLTEEMDDQLVREGVLPPR